MVFDNMSPEPIRNANLEAASVLTHNGEFGPEARDIELPGRGDLAIELLRQYRSSRHNDLGEFGNGWFFNLAKRLEWDGDGIQYHDGKGRVHSFIRQNENEYQSAFFYALLNKEDNRFKLNQPHGRSFVFESPDEGGRLLAIIDKNENSISLEYSNNTIYLQDPFKRTITVQYEEERIVSIEDYTGRVWEYSYNNNYLISVSRPDGSSVDYDYDENGQLIAVTDPRGERYLEISYDDIGRVSRQRHGNGTYSFSYQKIGESENRLPIYQTTIIDKGEEDPTLELRHNHTGQVTVRTAFVSAESLHESDLKDNETDRAELVTRSRYNKYGELIQRTFPDGDSARWEYNVEDSNPRARGNLLRITQSAASDIESDHDEISIKYTYDERHQFRTSITNQNGSTIQFDYDTNGNLLERHYPEVDVPIFSEDAEVSRRTERLSEKWVYNASGQIIQSTDATGNVISYRYYPEDTPSTAEEPGDISGNAEHRGGYLAHVTYGAESDPIEWKLEYNPRGSVTALHDPKGAVTQYEHDVFDRTVKIFRRDEQTVNIEYDAAGNPVVKHIEFDQQVFDSTLEEIEQRETTVTTRLEYNSLNNIISRTFESPERTLHVEFERDERENVARKVLPDGMVMAYQYDARNLLLRQIWGEDTEDETTEEYTWSRDGLRTSRRNGRGDIMKFHHDGLRRYLGHTNEGGTTKRQSYDAAGNIINIQMFDSQDEPGDPLIERWFEYDSMSRPVRYIQAWQTSDGEPLGESNWDYEEGVVSVVTAYGPNNLPTSIWTERGNGSVVEFNYDEASRLTEVVERTSNTQLGFEYDANSNPIHVELRSEQTPGSNIRAFHQVYDTEFDEMDRPVARYINDEPKRFIEYNTLGAPLSIEDADENQVQFLYDDLGRSVGRAVHANDTQWLVSEVEVDDNGRIETRRDPMGTEFTFEYDSLGRRTGVQYPDETTKSFEWDTNGNITRIEDQSGNVIEHQYDALSRLTERVIHPVTGDERIEQFTYDALNRLVSAETEETTVRRQYDSLSRLITEEQNGLSIDYDYDQIGLPTRIRYPSGREINQHFDDVGRLTYVEDENGIIVKNRFESGQLATQNLSEILTNQLDYANCSANCLQEVLYWNNNDELVDGHQFIYDIDDTVREVRELYYGTDFGERYAYDSANRLTEVQYGAELDNNDDRYQRLVEFDLNQIGNVSQKIVTDEAGDVLAELETEETPRHAYTRFGEREFEYDDNGNRIYERGQNRESDIGNVWELQDIEPVAVESEPGCAEREYEYDYANRLIRARCLDENANETRTTEYKYDAFGRPTIVQTFEDETGDESECRRIWHGYQLLEEEQNGETTKSVAYNLSQPVQLTLNQEAVYVLTHDGRGNVTSLVNEAGQVEEKYRYDVFGNELTTVAGGEPVIPDNSLASPIGNPFLAAGSFGGFLSEDQIWNISLGPGGNSIDTSIGQSLNPESRVAAPGCGNQYGSSGGIATPGGNSSGSPMAGSGGVSGGFGGVDPRLATTEGGTPFWNSPPGRALDLVAFGAAYVIGMGGATVAEASLLTVLPLRLSGNLGGSTLEHQTVWEKVHDALWPEIVDAARDTIDPAPTPDEGGGGSGEGGGGGGGEGGGSGEGGGGEGGGDGGGSCGGGGPAPAPSDGGGGEGPAPAPSGGEGGGGGGGEGGGSGEGGGGVGTAPASGGGEGGGSAGAGGSGGDGGDGGDSKESLSSAEGGSDGGNSGGCDVAEGDGGSPSYTPGDGGSGPLGPIQPMGGPANPIDGGPGGASPVGTGGGLDGLSGSPGIGIGGGGCVSSDISTFGPESIGGDIGGSSGSNSGGCGSGSGVTIGTPGGAPPHCTGANCTPTINDGGLMGGHVPLDNATGIKNGMDIEPLGSGWFTTPADPGVVIGGGYVTIDPLAGEFGVGFSESPLPMFDLISTPSQDAIGPTNGTGQEGGNGCIQ